MNRKLISYVALALVLTAGSATADIFVTPYGSYSFFKQFSSNTDLEISATPEVSGSFAVSRRYNAVGGGLIIGSSSATTGAVFGLNIEYLKGKSEHDFYIYGSGSAEVVGNLSIESPAMAVGGFIGVNLFDNPQSKYQSILGVEVGALMPSGKMTLTYSDNEEKVDFGKSSMYVSFFFTEDFKYSGKFGATGTLGYRAVSSGVETIETESTVIGGGYIQEYSGLFIRLGLKINI